MKVTGSDLTDYPVLVTGTAGFIGFHVAQALLARGARVAGLDNFSDYYSPALKRDRDQELRKHANFTSFTGDLADLAFVQKIFESFGPRRICHLAAQAGPCNREMSRQPMRI